MTVLSGRRCLFRMLALLPSIFTSFSSVYPQVGKSDSYPELVNQALAKTRSQDWAQAAALWTRVLEMNPYEARK